MNAISTTPRRREPLDMDDKRARFIEFAGERLCIRDWAARLGVDPDVIVQRLRHGWSIEAALTKAVRPRHKSLAEAFVGRFTVDQITGCWNWTGRLSRHGYGRVGKGTQAHRVAYELHVGPIPVGLDVDHLCRNRRCVNPAHLEPVTPIVNCLRGESAPARNSRKTHCQNGHPLAGENLYLWRGRRGEQRRCRACDSKRAANRKRPTSMGAAR